ncbi:porin [Oryzomicrobium sp.]|uniref:porin n=1 Tax=Oryzomicrobium sp. TaxID=1911578 RepID=UPI002FE159CF
MQKKLIALAVAGLAAAPAFAQTNVTIYGVADATFDNVRATSASSTAAGVNGNLGSTNRVSSNSSYLGFKGSEDLGNGLKAVFQFENTVAFDAAGGVNTNRDSFVGLAGGFGTVVAGNLTGPTRALGAALDVNSGATGIGANSALIGKLGNLLTNGTDGNSNYTATGTPNANGPANGCNRSTTCASLFDTRWKNAVAYVSPSFAGVTVTAAYVANEGRSFDYTASANQVNTQGYDLGVNYNNGPILAGLTYNAVTLRDINETRVSNVRLGGSYNFGIASVRALVERASLETTGAGVLNAGSGSIHQTVWGLGATFNVTTNGKIITQFYRAQNLSGEHPLVAGNAAETGAKLFELGYEHSLSKRTTLKAVYSYLGNDKRAAYDYGVNATGLSTAPNGGQGATLNGVQVGVRHSF